MFSLAEIRSLNEAENNIKIRDLYNSALYDIPLENHIHFQSMPLVGDIVMYYNLDDKIFKIVKIWQIAEDPTKRQGEFLLKSGELQLQGIFGQYIYLDNNGSIKFVDSTMLNEFELNLEGFIAKLKKYSIETYDGITVTIDEDIVITRKQDEDIALTATINDNGINIVNNKAEVIIKPDGNITVKGEKIELGNQLYGDVVTSGPNGTWPICPVTGQPIIGSSKVKAEG